MSWSAKTMSGRRLWFEAGRGLAQWDGVAVSLLSQPRILGVPGFEEIHYVHPKHRGGLIGLRPRDAQIKPHGQVMRALTDGEMNCIEETLTRMHRAALAALSP